MSFGVGSERIDRMQQSQLVALLLPEGSESHAHPEKAAVLLMRRADGQLALATIDARLARARRAVTAGSLSIAVRT